MKFTHGLRGEHVRPCINWLEQNKASVFSEMFEFNVYVGLRVTDLIQITVAQAEKVLLTGRLDEINQSKTKKNRTIPLKAKSREVLIARVAYAKAKKRSYLFFSESNRAGNKDKPMTRQSVSCAMTEVQQFINSTYGTTYNLSSHSMRKTLAKSTYEYTGKDLMATRDILQHSTVRVTEAYLGLTQDAIDSNLHALPTF